MGLDRIVFEDAWAALVGLVALVPLTAAALSTRRSRDSARQLGLAPARGGAVVGAATAIGGCALLALAAAQPALEGDKRRVRTDVEAVFVVDVSRSMLASPGPGARTRLDRAKAVVRRLGRAIPDVPVGVAGLTDRVLPYSFPTADRGVFAEVLARSVTIDAPPPTTPALVATSFDTLGELDRTGFFSDRARRRLCVVVTDGESRSIVGDVDARRCSFHLVQVGAPSDRIFGPDGRLEPGYPPAFSDATALQQLAAATSARVWPVARLDEATAALRAEVGVGPTRDAPGPDGARSLAVLPAGAALALAVGLALPSTRRPRVRSPATVAARPAPIP